MKASAIPIDCGLYAGVVIDTRFGCWALSRVCGPPLWRTPRRDDLFVDPDGKAAEVWSLPVVSGAARAIAALGPFGLVFLAGFATGLSLSALKTWLQFDAEKKIKSLKEKFTGLYGHALPGDIEKYSWGLDRQRANEVLRGLRALLEEIQRARAREGLTQAQKDELTALEFKVKALIEVIEKALREAGQRGG